MKKFLATLGLASLLVVPVASGFLTVQSASAQTIPTWSTSSTNAIVTPAFDQMEDSTVWSLATIVPLLIIVASIVLVVGVILGIIWFFTRKATNGVMS